MVSRREMCRGDSSAGIIALRPERDGRITGYSGLETIRERYHEWLIDWHTPEPGTPTAGVEAGYMANAWIRMKHPDYETLALCSTMSGEQSKSMLDSAAKE